MSWRRSALRRALSADLPGGSPIDAGRFCRRRLALRADVRGRQSGAALVVSMLILTLLSMITLSSADQSVMQERMASNQHSQANTFLAAEAGIIAAKGIANDKTVKEAVLSGDADAIESAWRAKIGPHEGWSAVGGITNAAEFRISPIGGRDHYWDEETKTFGIFSRGRLTTRQSSRATRTLGARIAPAQRTRSGGSSPFVAAVVAKNTIDLGGGAQIDSYNSNYGAYGSQITAKGNTFTNRSSVADNGNLSGLSARTCAADATIRLSGYSPIYGDVIGTGDLLTKGGTPVYGNIHVNGDADFNSHVYGNLIVGGNTEIGTASIVEGNVQTGGYFYSSGRVTETDDTGSVARGTVTAGGEARFSSASVTDGKVTAGGDVNVDNTGAPPPVIRAGGEITLPPNNNFGGSITGNYVGNLSPAELKIADIQPVAASDADCSTWQRGDPGAALAAEFSALRQNPATLELAEWLDAQGCSHCYQQGSNGFAFTGGGTNTNGQYESETNTVVGAAGQTTLLHVPSNVSNNGELQRLTIRGHVTLLVDGNFTISGGVTIDVGSSATLTLMVTGRTTLSSGTSVASTSNFVRAGPNGDKRPAISVYSTYVSSDSSDAGVTVGGYNSSYIAVYSPTATVNVSGSGDIYGSVVAGEVRLSGSGDIHYDEALEEVAVDGSSETTTTDAWLVGWWQMFDR